MKDDFYFDILDDERRKLLPLFSGFKSNFYLAGGTGLALQIGHRDSIDFDFFTSENFFSDQLFAQTLGIFKEFGVKKIQEEKDTLSILVHNSVKISYFYYSYCLLEPLVNGEFFNFCSLLDIGCMKLSALVNRNLQKDYVDLYFISQKIGFKTLLDSVEKKYPSLDLNLVLKSLVYFDDLAEEPISYKNNQEIPFETIKLFFIEKTKSYVLP